MRHPLIACSIIVVAGCATPYQSRSGMGGFSETQLDNNVFQALLG